MKKLSILVFALFLIFAFGFQVYADDLSVGTTGNNGNNVGTRGMDLNLDNDLGDRDNLGNTLDRTNTINNRDMDRNGVNGYRTNNLRTNDNDNLRATATQPTDNWGWLGILGLLGLAGMFGRNKNPER